jgi:hypothetical protein
MSNQNLQANGNLTKLAHINYRIGSYQKPKHPTAALSITGKNINLRVDSEVVHG